MHLTKLRRRSRSKSPVKLKQRSRVATQMRINEASANLRRHHALQAQAWDSDSDTSLGDGLAEGACLIPWTKEGHVNSRGVSPDMKHLGKVIERSRSLQTRSFEAKNMKDRIIATGLRSQACVRDISSKADCLGASAKALSRSQSRTSSSPQISMSRKSSRSSSNYEASFFRDSHLDIKFINELYFQHKPRGPARRPSHSGLVRNSFPYNASERRSITSSRINNFTPSETSGYVSRSKSLLHKPTKESAQEDLVQARINLSLQLQELNKSLDFKGKGHRRFRY